MWRIRQFEERVAQLKRILQVHGLIHLSIGGEGVAAAVCGQLRDDDGVYSGHRAHGHAIAKGAPLPAMMAELMGRADGLCRGLGGLDAPGRREHGLLGATGVVGGNLPLALGNALAARVRGIRPGDGRVLRRRRRPGRALQRVGQPGGAVGAAGDLRVREQRLRRVHAAVGAHRRRARQRRRRAVRIRARDGRRQRRGRGLGGVRRVPRHGARRRRPDAARVPHAPPRRPLRGRPAGVPRPARRGGVAAAAIRWPSSRTGAIARGLARPRRRDGRSSDEAAAAVERRSQFARASPFPEPGDRGASWCTRPRTRT